MPGTDFSDATLLLVAHGSSVNADSAKAAHEHARALRARALFANVHVAFWKQEPFLKDAAASIKALGMPRRVFVAPLFLSDGYFTQQVIPRELGFAPQGRSDATTQPLSDPTVQWLYCAPIGTHPRMTDLIVCRADEAMREGGAPRPAAGTDVALVLAAHGTERDERSRLAAQWQVEQVRRLGRFGEVQAAFMEEEPRIPDVAARVRSPHVVVVPFFISDGMHVCEDIPVLLGEEPAIVEQRLRKGLPTWVNPTSRAGKQIWYARAVGTSPLVVDIVLERVLEAAKKTNQAH